MDIAKTITALFLCLVSSAPSYADATDLIPPEYCGVVVASEKSIPLLMASPNLAVYANHQVWVFGTNKGAFAAVVGITRKEGREGIFGELLENGFILDDAFCSGGDKFWGLATEPPEGPLPVFGELPQPEQAGEELVIPPVRNVSPEEIFAVQPIQEGPLDMMLPQVKKMGGIYHDHAISMGTGSAGNTVGDGLLEPYRCANIARALGMTGSLGEGGAFQYLQPNDDPYEFLQISAELDVWVATAEAVIEMSPDQRIAMWNLECVGNHGIPFETYREDESEGADLVVKDGILNVLGGIDFGFYDRFKTVLDAHPEITIISLGSGGGSVADALQAGQLIRERGLKTQLYGKCFSACPMVFAGGIERVIYWPSKAALGFHQIYTDDGPVPITSEVYGALRAYLDEMGVDADTFIGLMTRAGPEDMYEPDVGDLCKPRIATWVQRTCDAPAPQLAESPAYTEGESPTAVSPAWYDGETLEWEATIGQWINTTDDVRLRTAAYYINGLVRSDDLLRAMIANGQFLEISTMATECANQMALFTLNTGQKSKGDRVSDIVVVCAGMVN